MRFLPRFTPPFPDPQMEAAYRRHRLEHGRRALRVTAVLVAVLLILLLPLDGLRAGGRADAFALTLAARAAGIVALFYLAWRMPRTREPAVFEWLVCGAALTVILQMFLVQFLIPESPAAMTGWIILAIFLLYAAVPISLGKILFTAGLLSFGGLYFWWKWNAAAGALVDTSPLVYLGANGLGLAYAIQRQRDARRQFQLLRRNARSTRPVAG